MRTSEIPTPFFSIVTVCLNPGKKLGATLETILRQGSGNYEVIIKDAGSSDGTEKFIPPDPRVRFVSRRDEGIFDAMNQALEYCSGRYIQFLNAGDGLSGDHILSRVEDSSRRNHFPPIVYTDFRNQRSAMTTFYPERLSRRFLYRKSLCHQSTFIRADCYRRFGKFDLSFPIAADNEYLARLVLQENVGHKHCPSVGIFYQDDGFSSLPANRKKLKAELARIRKRYFGLRERIVYGFCWKITLPEFRMRFVHNMKSPVLQKMYSGMANFINCRFM